MAYAQDTLLLGVAGAIHAGEEVPKTFINSLGEEEDTDFDRLEDLGLIGDKPPEVPAEEPQADVTEEVTEAPEPKAARKPAAKKATAKKPAAKRKPAAKK